MPAPHQTITDRIRADHRTVTERLAELERRAAGLPPGQQGAVFAPMRADLLAHMNAEEEFVYGLLGGDREPWIANARQEHQVIRDLLRALAVTDAPAAVWLDRLGEMRRVLEQHVEEEERTVLSEFDMAFDRLRLRDLGDEFEQRKEEGR